MATDWHVGCLGTCVRIVVLGALAAVACADGSSIHREIGGDSAPPAPRDAGRAVLPRDGGQGGESGSRRGAAGSDANLPHSSADASSLPADARDTSGIHADSAAGDAVAGGSACLPLALELLTSDLENPIYATAPAGDDRIFVVERVAGRIVILAGGGAVSPTPFLKLSAEMSSSGFEAGALGLAFPPDFATSRRFFVSYTTLTTLRVSRFQVPAETSQLADPESESIVTEIPQVTHHNTSGMLLFGPDGYLYVSTGDDDDEGVGQDLGSLKSKLLRLDVSREAGGHTIPVGNPFVGRASVRPEIWAYGLREPYRFWLDRTGDLYVADVGDNQREEIDVVPRGAGGKNFGWPILEGSMCHTPSSACDTVGLTPPAHEVANAGGSAIIGGSVYRGAGLSQCHFGRYFFGLYPSGVITSLRFDGAVTDVRVEPGIASPNFVSFGQDGHGEILLLGYDRTLHRLVSRND